MFSRLRLFRICDSGNVSVLASVLSLPLIFGVGLATDYSRHSSARAHLQSVADATALALAASKEQSESKLRAMADDAIASNTDLDNIENVVISKLDVSADAIDLDLDGDIPAIFMKLAGYDRLATSASAMAERAVNGNVEVALVLDNTWSMSEVDAKGKSKIDALKTASELLIEELLRPGDGSVKIALVPYADYVNVGTQYRSASWLSVPSDYTTEPAPKTCVTKTTKTVCDKQKPKTTCTREVDGVSETYSCGGGCEAGYSREVTVAPYQSCSGGGSGTAYKWYGCIGSRMTGTNRLNDLNPSVRYPGYVETSQKCLNPIVPLSSNEKTLVDAARGMIINRGSYKPYTYIPAGLTWGLNVLAPGIPFDEPDAYDPVNLKPRKVAVLMTDGENTLRFNAADGRHAVFNGNETNKKKQFATTNAETLLICDYMKSKNIEIYTVAFMVDDAAAKDVLEKCATDTAHYFDASDSENLLAAFSNISSSLRVVRLAR